MATKPLPRTQLARAVGVKVSVVRFIRAARVNEAAENSRRDTPPSDG